MAITLFTMACTLFAIVKATEIINDDGSGEMTCMEGDHVFTFGERMPTTDPCVTSCRCAIDGRKRCSRVMCEYPACFDAVRDTKKDCCPRCPNGANCKLDNLILSQGESVVERIGRRCNNICTCIYGGQEPTCVLQCDDVPPLALLDDARSGRRPRRLWKPIRRQDSRRRRKHYQLLLP